MPTAADAHDTMVKPDPYYGEATEVWSDCAYQSHTDAVSHYAPKARNPTGRRYRDKAVVNGVERAPNRIKSPSRSRVELIFKPHQKPISFYKNPQPRP